MTGVQTCALPIFKVLSLCGGTPIGPQRNSLEHGAHIVVGTPGRLMDHLERGSLRLDALNTLVLDEADRMLDMGFYDDIVVVAEHCPVRRQTMLFSATYPEGIAKLANQFLRNPQEVKLLEQHENSKIRQRFYEVKHEERLQAVATLLKHYRPISTLAFCNTKQQCRDLVDVLHAEGFHALTLNGDLEQRERDQVLIQFANRSCSVLVATDVAARGLDIDRLEAVVNVDVTPDPEIYIHRIGRTGRAGREGLAVTFAEFRDRRKIFDIEGYSRQPFKAEVIPGMEPTQRFPQGRPEGNGRGREGRENHSRDRRFGRGEGRPAFGDRAARGPRMSDGQGAPRGFGDRPGFGGDRAGFGGGRRDNEGYGRKGGFGEGARGGFGRPEAAAPRGDWGGGRGKPAFNKQAGGAKPFVPHDARKRTPHSAR